MVDLRTSGDLLADRRYRLAEDYAADGDVAAAADLLTQALERVPDWAPAWLALGLARERNGDPSAALEAFRRAEALDADGTLGVSLHRARLEAEGRIGTMPPTFVRTLFDGYADRFDDHLAGPLRYRGPALIVEALGRAGWTRSDTALDLGCGTGLMAREIAGRAAAIDGVDLSPNMVAQAQRTGFYRSLAVAEMASFLTTTASPGSYDLVLAADVLVYAGDLDPILAGVSRVLRAGGLFAFTAQRLDEPQGYRLGADMRFSHSAAYVEGALDACSLMIATLAQASTREDRGAPVPGLVVVARRA